MNRKLIRPNLSDVKGKERDTQQYQSSREHGGSNINRGSSSNTGSNINGSLQPRRPSGSGAPPVPQSSGGESNASFDSKNRRAPSAETNAEIYYYKKQIDSHTPMVIVLQDGEEIEGTIEWYDVHALKVNRKNAPNIMLLKHNIKYMYKAEDRVSSANNMES